MAQLQRIPIDIPPGLNSDDTTFSDAPAWAEGCNVRFCDGRPQTIGGWESLSTELLTGVCRSVRAWTDNADNLNIGFGTNSNLQLWKGGSLYDITPTAGFTAGAVDGTGGDGFGTGAFGVGNFGSPSTSDFFPLTWSLAAWGQYLLASPRNQGLFKWSGTPTTPAAQVANAPAQITQMLVSPTRQVFALGCSQEVGGVFNPVAIRHSGIGDETAWTTDITSGSTSREYVLPGGGRIVGGLFLGRYLLVWTTEGLFLGTYVGQINQVWRFDRVPGKGGLIGPNAAAIMGGTSIWGGTAFWMTPERHFCSYTIGGSIQPVPCPIRLDFANNLTPSQADKICASSISQFGEVRWDYPDARDGTTENSRYVALCVAGPDAGAWYRGWPANGVTPARSAMVDAGAGATSPIGVTSAGNIYWHETGLSGDGGPLPWLIESADIYLSIDLESLVTEFWPDIGGQVGPCSVTFTGRGTPDEAADGSDEAVYGPFPIAPGQRIVDPGKMSGRLFRMTFQGASAPSFARIGKPVAKVKPRGRRA